LLAKVYSAALEGLDAVEVTVEVDTRPGVRQFVLVGLAGTEVKEARDRVTRHPARFMLVAPLNPCPCRREVNAISDHAGA